MTTEYEKRLELQSTWRDLCFSIVKAAGVLEEKLSGYPRTVGDLEVVQSVERDLWDLVNDAARRELGMDEEVYS
jgi:hypothetical protein